MCGSESQLLALLPVLAHLASFTEGDEENFKL